MFLLRNQPFSLSLLCCVHSFPLTDYKFSF
jgi:hypothetical protein